MLVVALPLIPASAGAHTRPGIQVPAPAPSTSFGPASCPGAPINPTKVVTGQLKVTGNAGPDVRLTGRAKRHGRGVIFGDTLHGDTATFVAQVIGAVSRTLPANGPVELLIVKDGLPFRSEVVTSDGFRLPFTVTEHGRYRLQVQQGPFLQTISSPIYFEPRRPRHPRRGGDRGRD